jgi:hypothetical protein
MDRIECFAQFLCVVVDHEFQISGAFCVIDLGKASDSAGYFHHRVFESVYGFVQVILAGFCAVAFRVLLGHWCFLPSVEWLFSGRCKVSKLTSYFAI